MTLYMEWYWLYKLKHLNRRPVNMNRIPYHLQVQIFQKHPMHTQIRLRQANSQCCRQIDQILAKLEGVLVLEQLMAKQYPYKKLLFQDYRQYNIAQATGCRFSDWADFILANAIDTEYLVKRNKSLCESVLQRHYVFNAKPDIIPLGELGPWSMNLQGVRFKFMKIIIFKMQGVAALRFARASQFSLKVVRESVASSFIPRVFFHHIINIPSLDKSALNFNNILLNNSFYYSCGVMLLTVDQEQSECIPWSDRMNIRMICTRLSHQINRINIEERYRKEVEGHEKAEMARLLGHTRFRDPKNWVARF